MQTCRQHFRNRIGFKNQHFGWDAITKESVVVVTASEYRLPPPNVPWFPNDTLERFVGAARVYVLNIAPHDGGVNFVLVVDWDEPLNVVVDITVLDSPVFQVIHAEG